jgi:hypothetical protein
LRDEAVSLRLALTAFVAVIALGACGDDSEPVLDEGDATTTPDRSEAPPEACGNAIVDVLDGVVVEVSRAADGVEIEPGEEVATADGFPEGVLLPVLVYRAEDGTLVTTGAECEDFPVPEPIP